MTDYKNQNMFGCGTLVTGHSFDKRYHFVSGPTWNIFLLPKAVTFLLFHFLGI